MTHQRETAPRRIGTTLAVLAVVATMLPSGLAHLSTPGEFSAMVPKSLPAQPVLAVTGVLHLLIAAAAVWPRTRRRAGLAFAILCLAYLPLHLWDFVRPDPVFAPPLAASLRVAMQLVLIWIGWWLSRARQAVSTQP